MSLARFACAIVAFVTFLVPNRIDEVFEKFWTARSTAEAARLVNDIVKSGITFDEALRRLKQGRSCPAQKSGVTMLSHRPDGGVEHFYAVTVPADYDPSRCYQVRFHLHGGVGGRMNNQPRGAGEIGTFAGAEQFYVIPYSWSESPWWSDDQVFNMSVIVDALKRRYNIDENRIVVSGVSDGGSGRVLHDNDRTMLYAAELKINLEK